MVGVRRFRFRVRVVWLFRFVGWIRSRLFAVLVL